LSVFDWLRNTIEDPRTERYIMVLIILNAVTLGLETSDSIMARYGPILSAIDRIIIAIMPGRAPSMPPSRRSAKPSGRRNAR
jgi:hypothetical protein